MKTKLWVENINVLNKASYPINIKNNLNENISNRWMWIYRKSIS